MKRLLLVMLLLLPFKAFANDLSVVMVDTFLAADTVADANEIDTFYTDIFDVRGYGVCTYYTQFETADGYTVFNTDEDLIYIYIQASANQVEWQSTLVDSATAVTDSGFATSAGIQIDTLGNWARFMVTRYDSTDADIPDSVDLVRGAKFVGWIIGSNK